MNKFLYSAILCALIGWPSVQPAEGKSAQRTVHTVSGGLALASAASAVVTGLGWLYSALNERGVASHADQPQAPEMRTKRPLAPRSVIVGTGTKTQPANIKRPSWFTRLFLQPTTHAGTKRWRAAFIASLAAALAGGTIWGATKQKAVQKPANKANDLHPENPLAPAPRGVLPPPRPPVVPAVAPAVVPATDGDNRQEQAGTTITNWWREQRQRRALAAARREGARDAREALVGLLQEMTQEEQQRIQRQGLAYEAAAAGSLRQVRNEQRAAEEGRARAEMHTAELEGQLARSEERLAATRLDNVGRRAFARLRKNLYRMEREGRQARIARLQDELVQTKEALAAQQAEAAAQIEVHRAEVARVRDAERADRDRLIASAREEEHGATERRFIQNIKALQAREKELKESLAGIRAEHEEAMRGARAVAARDAHERSAEKLRRLQVQIATLEAARDVSTLSTGIQTEDISPPASRSASPDITRQRPTSAGLERSRQILAGLRPPAPPSVPAPASTPLSGVPERSLRTPKAKVRYRAVGTYHSLNGADIREGDVVTVKQNNGKVIKKQRVCNVTGSDKTTQVSLPGNNMIDDEFGMSGQGKKYHSITVHRPVEESDRRRRPQSAVRASPYSAGVPARVAARQNHRVLRGTMLGQRPPSADSRKGRPGSAP